MPIEEALASRSVVIVAAHPDDETISAGGLLPRLRNPVVVTVTDGAPRNGGDAERAGCLTRDDYARLRRDELLGALDVAGVGGDQIRALNIVDQEAVDHPAMRVGEFLPRTDHGEPVVLPEEARDVKSRMISCFASQLHMLRHFPVDVERYRPAPTYDFTSAPHTGRLFYEHFDWGVTGERWRRLAGEALRTLGAGTASI